MSGMWLNKLSALMQEEFDENIFKDLGNKVITGPFAGMEISNRPVWNDGNVCAKLVGSYEFELHPAVRKAISRKPQVIVNVGCAEGYYAIGLAMRTDATVYAFDLNSQSLKICNDYAFHNGVVHRVQTLVGCKEIEYLNSVGGSGRRLYVSDCEGDELKLFGSEEWPAGMEDSDLIVECHDFIDPKGSSRLVSRFMHTHDVEIINPQIPQTYPFLSHLPVMLQFLIVTDKRPPGMLWLACWAKSYGRMVEGKAEEG